MSSFRSRQRASQRRDQTSRERAANSPAGGNQPPRDGDKPPRAPYSGPRPGAAKPDWQPRQDDRRFDKRGPRPEQGQDKRFDRPAGKADWQPRQDDRRFDKRGPRPEQGHDKRFDRPAGKADWQPRQDDRRFDKRPLEAGQERRYDRDRGPSSRKPLPEGAERAQDFRRDGPAHDKRYSRDRGPSGRKPLHTEDAPPRPFKPRAEGETHHAKWQDRAPREDRVPRDENAPRKLFSRREDGERDNRFRRDDKPQWQDRAPGQDRPPRDENAPRKLFSKREDGERDNRFRRDDKPQWQDRAPREDRPPRDENAPRKLFSKREDGERDNRFRRDDKPHWQDRAPRQDRPPRDENAPRKLFSKAGEEARDNRFRDEARGLQPLKDSHRLDNPQRRFEQRSFDRQQEQEQAPRIERSITGRLDSRLSLFAPCPRGLEQVLADELLALGAGDIAPADGGVAFAGDARLMMAANLHCRTASRILLRLAHGAYHAEQDIYRLAMDVDWPRWFEVSRTIKLKADGIAARVKSLDYIALTVKDAICDRFRQAQLGRPSVDTRNPDVRVNVFLTADTATVYLDTSGEPLFKRGWREETGEAPLRENLAAGILLLAGYDGSQALLDPLCGSGTFLVEAADIALKRAPGRNRRFGFEALSSFDSASWEKLQLDARKAELPAASLPIRGSDRSQAMVNIARANLERAGLADLVEVKAADVTDTRPHAEHGLIVANPPYGVRLEEQDQLATWYPELGDWLKAHFAGWTACLFSGDLRLGKLIRLAPKRRTPLFNGSLQCRLFVINMVEGSARKQKDGEEAADAESGGDGQ
ncbi:THUMP domain-containing protein [Chromobacterium amazonense]|uniref:THUMP domain-containing protein n=1 Tax=Chromobacterium amazonense TaxID=1382803 RepID=UPI0028E0A370|nr:THUMP domain-containing protein [Chromobacterium amazonense]